MRGSGVLNIRILSVSFLECFPAWPHGSYKPVCLFRTWLGKELCAAKITLPDFSQRIDHERKLKHIKAESICSEKIHSLFSCLWSLSAALLTAVSRIRSKNGCTNRYESLLNSSFLTMKSYISKIPSSSTWQMNSSAEVSFVPLWP